MKTIIHLFLFFVLFFKSVQNIVECDRVRHNLDLLLQTFNDSTRDNNEHVLSSICSENSIQCCSAREQHVLKTRSARDFSSLIGSICHPISEKIQTIESQLKSILKQILNKSFLSQKFEKFLPDLWDIIVPNARDSDGRPARDAIEQHVNRFFDLLFVAEYEKQKVLKNFLLSKNNFFSFKEKRIFGRIRHVFVHSMDGIQCIRTRATNYVFPIAARGRLL